MKFAELFNKDIYEDDFEFVTLQYRKFTYYIIHENKKLTILHSNNKHNSITKIKKII